MFGCYILKKHYNIPSQPVAGAFALCVDDEPTVSCFGEIKDQRVSSHSSAFHMWIQTENHIIDFMARIFPEAFKAQLMGKVIPKKMFQKTVETESERASDLNKPGDFITFGNLELTKELTDKFLVSKTSLDLLSVAETWFLKHKSDAERQISIHDNLGKVLKLNLPDTFTSGRW